MRRFSLTALGDRPRPCTIAAAVLLLGASQLSAERSTEPAAIVVELFTSQGCSSCPPADRLLTRLGDEGLPGAIEVIPLSYHVDYWNYIGWTDPFSSKQWSDRQRQYVLALGQDTLYTPQLVIQGSSQIVGSGAEELLREIARAQHDEASTAVDVSVELRAGQDGAGGLEASIATSVDDVIPGHGLELMIAVFEKELVTKVESGENARRELRNDYVVRRLQSAFEIRGRRGSGQREVVSILTEPGWDRSRLGVAAFAQDPVTLKIYGAAAAVLAP